MPANKAHNFDFTDKALRNIDYLLPKLKFSVMPSKIVRWLENFDEDDLKYAYDFLQVFEYINFTEFQYRIEDQLKSILKDIDDKDKIVVVPFGKFGKSATLVTYPLTHTDTYKYLDDKGRIFLTNDLNSFKKKVNCIILLDDFIGTGETFCNDYIDSKIKYWCDENALPNRFVMSAVVMENGRDKIETNHPNVVVKAQGRDKLYKKNFSPLTALGNVIKYQNFAKKYESKSTMGGSFSNGYGDSQSMIAFTHCTPDNTVPLFWWDEDWFPLFPRENRTRMDEAREFKKDIAFYIGICNRLKIDLLSLKEYKKAAKPVIVHNQFKYNNKLHHSVIALIVLKLDGIEDYIISHILGLTDNELDEVYDKARQIDFVDLSRKLTNKGSLYFKKLKSKISREQSRKETEQNLKPKELIYLPKTFEGLT